ncbi:MAG: DeoR/GlpR transcriptional regulator [Rhodobacteraceae bacterium]|nr:DeoR/GlpR transcriptional regulator [Paracoccaceae bacterium]
MPMNFRHSEILALARRDGAVKVDALAEALGVTVQTVRRDLADLCDAGALTRVHGGAVLPSGTQNIGYHDRRMLNADAKEAIGHATAERIASGASVFLDIGTTSEAVARALMRHEGLMVVTNNLNAATILAGNPDAEILLTGGLVRRSDGGLVGEVTADFVRQFRVDVAVVAASALDASGDALDYDFREVRVAQAMIAQARRAILAADSSKFTRSAPVRIAGIAAFETFVTDAEPPDAFASVAAAAGTEVAVI